MAAYPQRSDLRTAIPKKAATGQPYGEAGKQLAAQAAVPMGAPPAPPSPGPGGRGPLDRPTERPDEPLTAGSPFGPGPGPEALGRFPMVPSSPGSPQALLERLQALWQTAPEARNANLAALISAVADRASRGTPTPQPAPQPNQAMTSSPTPSRPR